MICGKPSLPITSSRKKWRWKMVLDLILKDDGGDKFGEANRGKLFRQPPGETEDLDEMTGREAVDDKDMTAEDIDTVDLGLN